MQATQAAARVDTTRPATAPKRYVALDAYRGFIMLLLASEGLGFAFLKNDPTWHRVASWFDHVPWEGAVFWDMIQPAFMFMVGVAMPFAFAMRTAKGATWNDNFKHVLIRFVRLILWAQVLVCIGRGYIAPQLIIVLCQIAFTYLISFLIMDWKWRWQVAGAVGLLAFWTALLYMFPGPDGPFSKTGSIGVKVDRAIFHYDYDPAYSTLNFIASTVWTLAGVWAGRLLMTSRTHAQKLRVLAVGMITSFALALALRPWIPMIKQLVTPSFVLYSLGWAVFMLIGFYWLIEMVGLRRAAFPLIVVGMNSIFVYSVGMVLHGWLDKAVGVFTFRFGFIGTLAPVAQSCTVLLVIWYMCYWLYRRQIFFKV